MMRYTALIVRHQQIEAMARLAKAAPALGAFMDAVGERLRVLNEDNAAALKALEYE